jgi:sulfur relay (sulfurtransferase) DsrF/TusC family protein
MNHVPFGAFNPRFYGISLFVGEDDRLDALARYETARNPAEWMKQRSKPTLHEICSISAVDHEMRHFHDFLLTPSGTVTMGLRMQASINGMQAMLLLPDCPGKFLPVPIVRWIEWDHRARQEWVKSTGAFFGLERMEEIVDIPHVPDLTSVKLEHGQQVPDSMPPAMQLNSFALGAAQAYVTSTSLRQRHLTEFDLPVSADDVFEASAHLIQLQAVWTGQGEHAAAIFRDFLQESSAKHLLALQVMARALKRDRESIDGRLLTQLFTWMLLGSWEMLKSTGHPVARYLQVLILAAEKALDDVFTTRLPAAQVFDRLDALTGSNPWRQNLESALAAAERRHKLYQNVAQTLKGGFFDAAFAVAAKWYSDQESLKRAFQKDPEAFADPLRYLNERSLPLPFLETRMGWRVHERSKPLDVPHARAITVDAEGVQVLSYIRELGAAPTGLGLDQVVACRTITHMIDFLFYDEPVMDLYEHWCRERIQALVDKVLISVY